MEPTEIEDATAASAQVEAGVPTGTTYRVDGGRATFGEHWRDAGTAGVVNGWFAKVLRVRVPVGVDDPNVESLRPFAVGAEGLPEAVRATVVPRVRPLAAAGFDGGTVAAYAVRDLHGNRQHYLLTLGRADGRAVARVVHRVVEQPRRVVTRRHTELLTEFADGTFLLTTVAKPRTNVPPAVEVRRCPDGATTVPEMIRQHEAAVAAAEAAGRVVRPAAGPAAVADLTDRHHAVVRDYHLRRGLFVPLTAAERATADAVRATFDAGVARGSASPEVLAEIEKLQANRTGWVSGVVLLVASMVAFVGLGLRGGGTATAASLALLAITVPVLLFHEAGHYLAMRVFRYRNVRMFFIPGFGAAVSGQGYDAPGWKKVIVSLMGPLPGIGAAAVVGAVGLALHNVLALKVAAVAVLLNGFNLLPLLPMDGGRVAQYLLFSRHWGLDVAFRVAAGVALVGFGFGLGGGRVLGYVGVALLVTIPAAARTGRLAAELRARGLAATPAGDHRVPPDVADVIVERVKAGMRSDALRRNNRLVAQRTLAVYEAVCARPPGRAASLGFAALHGAGLVVAVVLGIAFVAAANPRLADAFRRGLAAAAGTSPIRPDDTVMVGEAVTSSGPRDTVVAQFRTHTAAVSAFDGLRPSVRPDQAIERFGQTVLVSVPDADAAERHRWVAALTAARPVGVAVQTPDSFDGALTVTGSAPSADVAAAIAAELRDYLELPADLNLRPPWSARPVDPVRWARAQAARQTYRRLRRLRTEAGSDPAVAAVDGQIRTARHNGDTADLRRLYAQRQAAADRAYRDQLQRLRADPAVDPVVLTAFIDAAGRGRPTTSPADDSDDEEGDVSFPGSRRSRTAADGAMADRLYPDGPGSPEGVRFGWVKQDGTTVAVEHVTCADPLTAAPELIRWLADRGVTGLRYQFALPRDR